jgi:hypothetical protein
MHPVDVLYEANQGVHQWRESKMEYSSWCPWIPRFALLHPHCFLTKLYISNLGVQKNICKETSLNMVFGWQRTFSGGGLW